MKKLLLLASHSIVFVLGFALGIYLLPILTAPEGRSEAEVSQSAQAAIYTTNFTRDLKGSDALHWGEGKLSISKGSISFMGELAPGPDYRLYLVPKFVENEEEFLAVKDQSVQVGDVKTFDNFIVQLSGTVDPAQYTTAVIWCESFGEFITAGQYQ